MLHSYTVLQADEKISPELFYIPVFNTWITSVTVLQADEKISTELRYIPVLDVLTVGQSVENSAGFAS